MELANDALKYVARSKDLITSYLNTYDRFIMKDLEEAESLLELAIDILSKS